MTTEKIDEKIKKYYRQQAIKDIKRHKHMKVKGAKYVLIFWVHPYSGDDFEMFKYLNRKPTKIEIKKIISNEGSTVFTDYKLKKL